MQSKTREELHEVLCSIMGSRNVYFQPPVNISMHYPCIRYTIADIDNKHANDRVYLFSNKYQLILIDEDPDSEFVYTINQMPTANFIRSYVADNLNHWVFEILF